MRCPQCGYNSYEALKRCKKCGAMLRPLQLPERSKMAATMEVTTEVSAEKSVYGQVGLQQDAAAEKKVKPFPQFLLEPDDHTPFFLHLDENAQPVDEKEQCSVSAITGASDRVPLLRRILATVLDYMVMVEIWYAFVLVGAWVAHQPVNVFTDYLFAQTAMRICYYFLAVTIIISYFTLLHCCYGQTLGKMLLGFQVVDEDGNPPTISQALLRSAGGILALLCVGYGYLTIIFDSAGRGWNDRVAGTQVVAVSKLVSPMREDVALEELGDEIKSEL
ncbi:MAG: hypothetical protein B6I36_01085 [Desulfobacteraceae bacterium 4572_35.1]|nr:MAG: hypothetical protein B6I36_01085 [Desulfobacteraceae bacterium 4572_35.1]